MSQLRSGCVGHAEAFGPVDPGEEDDGDEHGEFDTDRVGRGEGVAEGVTERLLGRCRPAQVERIVMILLAGNGTRRSGVPQPRFRGKGFFERMSSRRLLLGFLFELFSLMSSLRSRSGRAMLGAALRGRADALRSIVSC